MNADNEEAWTLEQKIRWMQKRLKAITDFPETKIFLVSLLNCAGSLDNSICFPLHSNKISSTNHVLIKPVPIMPYLNVDIELIMFFE